jgi:maltose alpha-D-glucosyltransferase/alpha-amylase
MADITSSEGDAILYDAMYEESTARALLMMASGRRKAGGSSVALVADSIPGSRRLYDAASSLPVRSVAMEQTNTSVVFGEDLILKLYRRVEFGANPEVEVGRFLTERAGLKSVPHARGLLNAVVDGHSAALAFAQDYVPSVGNAFDLTLDTAVQSLEQIVARIDELGTPPRPRHPMSVTPTEMAVGREVAPQLLVDGELLGRRTAEMHLALASSSNDPVFAPERLSTLQQRSLYQAIRTSVRTSVTLLKRSMPSLRSEDTELAQKFIDSEHVLLEQLRAIASEKVDGVKIRIHGDFHLGQVLNTGIDFVIIDFEGEPQRPLSQRRLKRMALRDVAGMIRSYHYAMVMAHQRLAETGLEDGAESVIAGWAHAMHRWVSAAYLAGYRETIGDSPLVPQDEGQFRLILDALLVEKAAYELEYELNNRPDWVEIPLQGILETVG